MTELLTQEEHKRRLAFAQRQWEHFKLRVVQAQTQASCCICAGDTEGAKKFLGVAQNYIEAVSDCNDTIDGHLRAILPESPEGFHKVDTKPHHRGL